MAQGTDSAKAVGVDIGTSRIVAARPGEEGVRYSAQLNAFIDIPASKLTAATLSKEGVLHTTSDGKITVHGSNAVRFADLLGTDVRRSIHNGMLATDDEDALVNIRTLLENVAGRAGSGGQRLYFSTPAPVDGLEQRARYGEACLCHILEELGYQPRTINEGLAVVYAEMESTNFSGIGVNCGAGLCNICFAYLSVPVVTFAIAKAGDYIDSNAAAVAGELPSYIRMLKEDSFHLNGHCTDKMLQALTIYYDDVIATIVREMKSRLEPCARSRRFRQRMPVVLSGGSVLVKGFPERFEKALAASDIPMNISEVRVAAAPLETTASGALMAALSDQE